MATIISNCIAKKYGYTNSMLLAPEDYVRSFFTNTDDYYEIYLGSNEYHSIHPCKDLEHFPSCTEYCSWHKRFFENIDRSHV